MIVPREAMLIKQASFVNITCFLFNFPNYKFELLWFNLNLIMRKLSFFILLILFSTFDLINCANSAKRVRPPVTSIKIISKNSNYTIGEPLSVEIKTKIKDGTFRKTELFLDGKSLILSEKPDFSYQFDTKNLQVGTHYLKSLATTNDGIIGENFNEFLLKSDLNPQKFSYKIVKTYPHNTDHFTEGLEIKNGYLYEGTGQEGSSAIYKTDLSSWKTTKEFKLDDQYFGEGITILNNKLYQLTYKTQIGFVRDLNTFDLIKTWYFKNEQGWGLTNDGECLIMSDGTQFLTFIDSQNFNEIRKIEVCDQYGVVKNINELEYINGLIWANIWTTDKVVEIDPKTGKIIAEIDLGGLLSSVMVNPKNSVDVLNGIAYDHATNKIYVTGKLWPKLFEIEIVK